MVKVAFVGQAACISVLNIVYQQLFQNHWFTYNENMSVESVTQAVSNLALAFGDDDPDPGAMVCV